MIGMIRSGRGLIAQDRSSFTHSEPSDVCDVASSLGQQEDERDRTCADIGSSGATGTSGTIEDAAASGIASLLRGLLLRLTYNSFGFVGADEFSICDH